MSVSLRITFPTRPYDKARPVRLRYRVVLQTGKEITLPVLSRELGISHGTLMEAIKLKSLPLGTYGQEFMEILAAVRAKRKRSHTSKWVRCEHCKGKGRTRIAGDTH